MIIISHVEGSMFFFKTLNKLLPPIFTRQINKEAFSFFLGKTGKSGSMRNIENLVVKFHTDEIQTETIIGIERFFLRTGR